MMKQTVVVTNFRFVQMPITDCLFAVTSVANLPFRPIVPIAEQMEVQGQWADLIVELDDVLELEDDEQVQETRGSDPLLELAGTLECEVSNIDDMILSEMQQTKADQAQETQVSDPLLRLVGTLECEVTDIGERHDDYIGDALLVELQGDNDE